MHSNSRLLTLLLIFVSSLSFSQISLSTLKNAGIKSEEDLKKLGVSQNEINKLKQEYVENPPAPSKDVQGEVGESFNSETETQEVKVGLTSEPDKSIKSNIFGHDIFRNGSVQIQTNSNNLKASDSYILGTGDKINVTIWGFSEFSDEYTLDENGNITPKLVGRINLKGKDFKTVRSIIKSRFGKVYDLNNSKIAIELSFSNLISINVVGEVMNPGTYSFPSINTAFNFLSVAGGPNQLGSVRELDIIRDGNYVESIDVYEFLLNQKKSKNQFLKDGDYLVVKAKKNIVEINGEVNREGLFELKEGERFSDLLNYASGYKPLADKNFIHVTRIENDGKKLYSISTTDNNFKLRNGDLITVNKVSEFVKQQVSIEGAINVPGNYEFIEGEKILSLIQRANGINFQSFLNVCHIYRLDSNLKRTVLKVDLGKLVLNPNGEENITLKNLDKVRIFKKDDFLQNESFTVKGSVRNPGVYQHKDNLTVNDAILLSGGLLPQAYDSRIEIERIDFNLQKSDSSNYLKIIKLNTSEAQSFKLNPYDVIYVRKLPSFHFHETIKILGEVKYPGEYSLSRKNETLMEVIERAGGMNKFAYFDGISIKRKEDNLGILVLDMKKILTNKNSAYNYVIKSGDEIFIPKKSNVVSVSGAIGFKSINNEDLSISAPFKKGKRAKYYVRKFGGGFDKGANKKEIFVTQTNGLVKKSRWIGLLSPKIKNGDKIVVIQKIKKEKKTKEKIDWNRQIENITIKLTGVASLWVLLSNINF